MIKVAIPLVAQEEINAVSEVLKSGMYISGKNVEKFEKNFAKFIGTKYAVACNSGTAALHMVYKFLDLNFESRFIVSPMGFFATISAGLMCNSFPIFIDVDRRCNMNPEMLKRAITEKVKVIVPTHFYGHPCEIERIIEIANYYNIPVIEDCAQAHGAEYNGQKVGSFGLAGCFSFFATKNMTTIEGGMITTNSKELYEYCKIVRSHGMTDRNTHTYLGYNYRMSEVNAAVGLIQLEKLSELNKKRIRNSLFLQEHINNKKLIVFKSKDIVKDVYFWQPVYTTEILSFKKWLDKNDIGFRFRYNRPLYVQPIFKNRYKDIYLSNAEHLSGKIIGLPNHPALSNEELQKIVDVVNRF